MTATTRPVQAFRHEAFFYAGEEELVEGAAGFVRDGLRAGEPTLVVVGAHKIERLRRRLGADADAPLLGFADLAEVGSNPARIIPAWQEFVARHADAPLLRGIGEPVHPGRTPAELAECERHESLLNLAFAGGRPWWLLCPYDTTSLDAAVLERAHHTHPYVGLPDGSAGSERYDGVARFFEQALPPVPESAALLRFDAGSLSSVRALVGRQAARAGLRSARIADLVLAANELATNSVRHGGGRGTLRVWQDGDTFCCEVADSGVLAEPMVGRTRPDATAEGARGLWLVNQLCDLVQLRTSPAGTVVRLHMRRNAR